MKAVFFFFLHLFQLLLYINMVVVQRSIIWSPHEDHSQFLAGGTELKLYQWVPEVIIATFFYMITF